MTKLISIDGRLHTPLDAIVDSFAKDYLGKEPEGPVLICEYPSGDVDTINWPNPNEKNLRSALCDARERSFL